MILYRAFIEDNFEIVDKESKTVRFKLNGIQQYFMDNMTGRDIILKARQQGFSSFITAMFATNFILCENRQSVIMADTDDNAKLLLQKVKYFLQSYERINHVKIKLKYDSKTEMYNPYKNSRITVGTSKNINFGRSRTINDLLLSEVAFYPDIESILAGAGQAVVEGGNMVLETTANGFNEFHEFWVNSKEGLTGFKPMFFKASDFYPQNFLEKKRHELKRTFVQEYPDNDTECFLSSGDCFFDMGTLSKYLEFADFYVSTKRTSQDIAKDLSMPFLRQFRKLQPGENIIIAGDCSAGGRDKSCSQFLSKNRFDVPLIYHTPYIATQMTPDIHNVAERIYDITSVKPLVAFERNNGGSFEMERLADLNRRNKYDIFVMPVIGKTKDDDRPSHKLGWDTNSATRPVILEALKTAVDKMIIQVYDPETIHEMMSFINTYTNAKWKAQAEHKAFDDRVMALAIAVQMFAMKPTLISKDSEVSGFYPQTYTQPRNLITGY